ncbi:hypothetical protein [Flavobacterium sp.]|uniref:hypothetical protein n=1 Tax=Flavobacterium sp. TaxID=239 RepID=UPI00345C960B
MSQQIAIQGIQGSFHHQSGSLVAVLNVMIDCRLKLAKMPSLLKIESPYAYAFFVDTHFLTKTKQMF